MKQFLIVRQFFYSASIDVNGFDVAEGLTPPGGRSVADLPRACWCSCTATADLQLPQARNVTG